MSKGVPKKVLIVDDDVTTLEVARKVLEGAGFAVVLANDGEAGLQLAELEEPDVIITDVLMPGMDGFTVFKELKKQDDAPARAVLILTSRDNLEDSFKRSGADGFIVKPIDARKLVETVTKVCP